MPRLSKYLPAVLLSLCAFAAAQAQTASVSIPAWIETDSCGATPKFEAELNGKSAAVTAQLGPASDQIILLVFDLTGDLSLIDAAKQALIAEIPKLPPNTWVGLLRAQDGLHVLVDPGADRKPLTDAIQSLSNSGEPGLLETVQPALSLADAILRKSPVRVSVVYITDSSIYSYREDYTNPVINGSDPHDLSRRFPEALIQEKISKLVEDVSPLEAPLFVVHLNYRRDRLNEAYQNGLGTLAECHRRQDGSLPIGGRDPGSDLRCVCQNLKHLEADACGARQDSQQCPNSIECFVPGWRAENLLAHALAAQGGMT